MRKMKRAKGFLWCLFFCVGITLLLAAPATADWSDSRLDDKLILDTEVTVFGRDPACDIPPYDCIPGLVELAVFDENGSQVQQLDLFDIVKVKAILEVTPDMPLPMQIRIVFGGLGYQLSPRDFTLRSPGTYSAHAYFLVSGEGNKTIGTKVWVRWLPTGTLPSQVDNITILDQVFVGPE